MFRSLFLYESDPAVSCFRGDLLYSVVGWQLKKLFFVIYRIFSLRIVNSKLRRHFLDFAKHEVEIPIYTTNTLTKYPKYYFDTSFDVHSEL